MDASHNPHSGAKQTMLDAMNDELKEVIENNGTAIPTVMNGTHAINGVHLAGDFNFDELEGIACILFYYKDHLSNEIVEE